MTIYAKAQISSDDCGGDSTISKIHVDLFYAENDDIMLDEDGVHMGYIQLYRVPYLNDSLIWADQHSLLMIHLAEFKNMCCDCSLNDFNNPYNQEDCYYYNHHILNEFYINPEFRGQGLAYEALFVGLKEAGCTDSHLYFYPNPMKEGEGLTQKQLHKFYKKAMGENNIMEYVNMERNGEKQIFFLTQNWNYNDSVEKRLSGSEKVLQYN